MTLKQFDELYRNLCKLTAIIEELAQENRELKQEVKELKQKTLIVTTFDQDIEKLKVDVAALIDERRA